MAGKRQKIKKTLLICITSLLLLLSSVAIFVWIKMPTYITRRLSDYVEIKSEGVYSLSIEKIERTIFPFSLTFNKVSLIPDKSFLAGIKNQKDKNLYRFTALGVEMKNIAPGKLITSKKIECKTMRLCSPSFMLEGHQFLQMQSDSFQISSILMKGLKPVFKSIREIEINKIEMNEADFDFYSAIGDSNLISRAEHISMDVIGFKTNASMVNSNTRLFETDNVIIKMNDFRNDMGDSLHVLNIDTLEYSLKTADIRAEGFKLKPLYNVGSKNLFDVEVPEVYIKSQNITKFAINDSLNIKYLIFKNADIKFFQKENQNRLNLEDINNFDLYTLVRNHFSKMLVDTFILKGAKLRIFRQPDYENYKQQFNSIDINLSGFDLDSASAGNKNKLFHADNLEMQVEGYHLRLEDNHHSFRADSLFVSTYSGNLAVKKIHIHPTQPHLINTRTEVNIECEALNIDNAGFLDLYHSRKLPVSKIEISNPDVHLIYHQDIKKTKRQNEAGLLFDLVTDYVRGVYSNLVFIENGNLNIQNQLNQKVEGYFETNFDFSLTDFTLDSASVKRTDKFFYATTFDLNFADYQMKLIDNLHKLSVKNVTVSSINQSVKIKNLELHPVTDVIDYKTMKNSGRSELFNISVPQISLNGTNLREAFFYKKLKISDFKISDPGIYFENYGILRNPKRKIELTEFYELIFNYIEDFDINRFSVLNGNLTWINHTKKGKTISFDNIFSASLKNFRLNQSELQKPRPLFSDSFNLTLKNQLFELSDSVHVIRAGEINISSAESQISVKDAILYPLISSDKYNSMPTKFQISMPYLKISGFDFQKAYYSKNPRFDKLELTEPEIEIYNQKDKIKKLNLNRYNFPVPKIIDSLKLGEFKITDANVITYESQGIRNTPSASFNFNLSLPSVTIKNNNTNKAELSGKNIIIDLSDFKTPLGEHHNFSLEKANFNRDKQKISLKGLRITPFMPEGKENYFTIYSPDIEITAFDFNSAVKENKFKFNSIIFNDPDINIEINQRFNNDTLKVFKELNLYPYIEPLADEIKINDLQFINVNLDFNRLQKQLFNNKLNINFKNILIGKDQTPSNLLNSKKFEISTTNLARKSKDGLYKFTVDSLKYNSAGHDVTLVNLNISPLYKKDKLSQKSGYQTDVVDAHISGAYLRGISEKKWLRDNILDAKAIIIGPSYMDIYRNKRYQLDPSQKPPWPQELIENIDQPFIFDSIYLMPSDIKYNELMGISDQPGYIEFNGLTFKGGMLTNIDKISENNNHFIIEANTRIYNTATLSATIDFDLSSPFYHHNIKGYLEAMELKPLNAMLSKAEPLEIEDGNLEFLKFDMTLNDEFSTVILDIKYDNLKIAVNHYNSPVLKKNKFASFWANNFIINSQYPKNNNITRPVSITYPHDEQRSIINYWWKSLYKGVKEALGLQKND